jgi:hypothetical protein
MLGIHHHNTKTVSDVREFETVVLGGFSRHNMYARLCKLQKWCTRIAAASDKVYQLLAHGRWFSPSTPASSTTKTGHHDIAEILLKVELTPFW